MSSPSTSNESLQTATLNNILNELKTLNNNFEKMEKEMRSMQNSVPPVKNPLIEILNTFDLEKVLKTLVFISQFYTEDKE